MIIVKIMDISSCNQNCEIHKMAVTEEEEVCHLVAVGRFHKVAAPYFVLFEFYIRGSAV